jgi:DNA-binding response OmpR family regulator
MPEDEDKDKNENNKPTNQMIIQIVDDEFDIVNVIKLYLQQIGFNAVGFTDSSLAFEHFRINCNDCMLVISDIRMPGMNGFEFVKKIREINTAVKVLLMSAFEINSTELSAGLGEAKIDGFIQKPVALHELNRIVQEQLAIKQPL